MPRPTTLLSSTSRRAPSESSAKEAEEALAELRDMARDKTLNFPSERVAQHILDLYPDAEWPVQRAALEALFRRYGFARRDDLKIAERPEGSVYGRYILRRSRRKERPYDTMLRSLQPILGSCDCADFRRASLGLCKHLLVVLEDVGRGPRVLERALDETPPVPYRAVLTWNSIRPLRGQGDFLDRVTLNPPTKGKSTAPYKKLMRFFAKGVGSGSVLRSTHSENPKKRLQVVEALIAFVRLQNLDERFCEPALAARLGEERERLRTALQLQESKTRMRQALRSLEMKLYPYQEEGVMRFLSGGRLLLADDMGLGKTAQAIASCHALFLTGTIKRGLLIVPAALKPQWLREWREFSSVPVALVEGSADERGAIYRKTKAGFLVANYEQVLRDLDLMKRWKPELVVLDEAQRIKNWATKTSHGVKELNPRFRLVLTGTPMENRLEELASIFDWVEDHALEPKWRLVPFHAEYVDGTRSLAGVKNLDVLRERLAPHMVRRVRDQVLKQLPPRTDSIISVPLTPEQFAQHQELIPSIAAIMRRASKRPLTQPEFLRLMQLLTTQRVISNGLAQLDYKSLWLSLKPRKPTDRTLQSLFSPKLIELRELVRQLVVHQGRKVVVFSQWRRMLNLANWAVSDLLGEEGLQARFFTGAEGHKRRTHNLVDFHDDPQVRVLFASDAGGVGLNLQRAANALINLEMPWNPAVLEQRIARIHRLGQTDPIDVYNLVGTGSIEERIANLVADKQQLFRGLFDGDTDTVHFDSAGGFLESVRRIQEEEEASSVVHQEEDESEDAELEELIQDADESTDEPEQAPEESPVPDVQSLFSQLNVEATASGGMRIEAPPEAAKALAALFQGMAQLLQNSE